jgi:hypothetical protein
MSAAVAAADPRIRVECVRTLYQQLPNSFVTTM